MALNFPASPVDGQIYYDPSSGNRYVYRAAWTTWLYAANNDPLSSTSNTQILYNSQGGIAGSNSVEFYANTFYAANIAVATNVSAQYYFGNGAFLTGVSPPIDLSAANAWANTVATAGNNYTVSVGAAANAWANQIGLSANIYAGYMVNAANAWANTKGGGSSVNVGAAAPVSPTVGNLWWDTNSGRLFIYYTDADSSQWVDASPTGSYALPNTYVTPATYGGATQIPVITIDAQGRINTAANVAVQGMDYPYANNIGGAYLGNNGQRSGPGGTGFGDIFRVHSNTLSTNISVSTGNNAIAAGPITIAVGQTLTINVGATVVIV